VSDVKEHAPSRVVGSLGVGTTSTRATIAQGAGAALVTRFTGPDTHAPPIVFDASTLPLTAPVMVGAVWERAQAHPRDDAMRSLEVLGAWHPDTAMRGDGSPLFAIVRSAPLQAPHSQWHGAHHATLFAVVGTVIAFTQRQTGLPEPTLVCVRYVASEDAAVPVPIAQAFAVLDRVHTKDGALQRQLAATRDVLEHALLQEPQHQATRIAAVDGVLAALTDLPIATRVRAATIVPGPVRLLTSTPGGETPLGIG